jgi:hypothetical protein
MKAATETKAGNADVFRRLDSVSMSKADRQHARASLRDGEFIAEQLMRAAAGIGAVAELLEYAAASTARVIKAMFVKRGKS